LFFSNVKSYIDAQTLAARIGELGEQITATYKDDTDLVIICTLKGSIIFVADLMRHVNLPVEVDFISIASYHGTTLSGKLEVVHGMTTEITGRHVLIVEDIVDTGRTLSKLKEMVAASQPKSIAVCALLDKPSRRVVPMQAEYVGFTIDDLFVVGFGLDYHQRYRNLPFIGVLDDLE
jgi:hypoxanthine phosphoribosyltransferase